MRKIGLDLGTGKCCVAIAHDGKVTVLPDARGNKTTPSFVAFNEYRTLAGSDARDQANINAANTAYGIKIILGRTLEDHVVIRKLSSESNVALPFPPYQAGGHGVPEFQFQYKKKKKLNLRPEQITALLIGKMKSIADEYLDRNVNGAVISVPVSFNTAQRQATLDAARIAGLKNSTLVNCTTAAAVAYWDHTLRKDDCIAVIDFGAGSVNFAIISITSGKIKVEEAYGDCEVGGSDIDLCMMSALVQKFNDENHVEFQRSTKALMRLRRATESLKHKLSLLPTGRIQEDAFSVEDYTSMTFTREEMVKSCKGVLGVVSAGLSRLKSSMLWDEVRCVVVVGGSTRIPAVQLMIASELNKPVDQSLNKDEAIACGAALLGSGSTSPPEVEDVLGRRIWCKSKTDDFVVFDIRTSLPDEMALELPLSCDMKVWENFESLDGKQDKFKLCSLLAHNANKTVHQGGLIFTVNESGIFRTERISEGKSIDIALKIPCLNTNALFGCDETHQMFLRDSKEFEENEDAMNDLEYFCSERRQTVKEGLGGNDELTQFLDSILQWLEDTPHATKKECDFKKREIDDKVRALQQHIGSHSYYDNKPPPGNGPYNSWSRDTREQLPDLGHPPVSHLKPGPGKGSFVVEDITPPPSKRNSPWSEPNPPDHLTGSPRSERHFEDLGLSSDGRGIGPDNNSSQHNTQQRYMNGGFPTKRQNDRINTNDVHQTPVVYDASHDENLNGRKTAKGSRPTTSRGKHSRTNHNYANTSHQVSPTPGVQKSVDATSSEVYGSPSQSTGGAVGDSAARQHGQDRSQLNIPSLEGVLASGGDANHHANESENHNRQKMHGRHGGKRETGRQVGGPHVRVKRSKKWGKGCCTLL